MVGWRPKGGRKQGRAFSWLKVVSCVEGLIRRPRRILSAIFEKVLSRLPRMTSLPGPGSRLLATRNSLIERLPNWEDRAKWQEFFDTYWRLIYGVARKSGLSDAEAQDVVQETVVSVAKNIGRYDKKAGSFKSWLLQLTRWRIIDQVRKRSPAAASGGASDTGRQAKLVTRPGYDGPKARSYLGRRVEGIAPRSGSGAREEEGQCKALSNLRLRGAQAL